MLSTIAKIEHNSNAQLWMNGLTSCGRDAQWKTKQLGSEKDQLSEYGMIKME